MRTLPGLLVLALLVSASPPARASAVAGATAPAPPVAGVPDPIEGKWYGTTGPPQDRVETGFDFRRNGKQEIKAYLYRPVINVYGAELPGVVARNGDARVPRITQVVEIYGYDYQAPRPALADGVVYVGAADGGFHAVSAATGQRVWRFEAKGKIRDNALVDGPRVVFGTLDGLLYAVDRATGKEAWKQDLKGDVTTSPVLAGGKLIVGTRGSTLYALRPETGETL